MKSRNEGEVVPQINVPGIAEDKINGGYDGVEPGRGLLNLSTPQQTIKQVNGDRIDRNRGQRGSPKRTLYASGEGNPRRVKSRVERSGPPPSIHRVSRFSDSPLMPVGSPESSGKRGKDFLADNATKAAQRASRPAVAAVNAIRMNTDHATTQGHNADLYSSTP
jgi:hypothetical protein